MIIALIGFITIAMILNIGYYEFRVLKPKNDMDLLKTWVDKKLTKRYKC